MRIRHPHLDISNGSLLEIVPRAHEDILRPAVQHDSIRGPDRNRLEGLLNVRPPLIQIGRQRRIGSPDLPDIIPAVKAVTDVRVRQLITFLR